MPVEAAIVAGMAAGDTDAVLRAVASSDVMVPQAGGSAEAAPDGSMSLPVIERDGTSYLPVFTSEATMHQAAPDIDGAISVPVAALPPDAVKSLPGHPSTTPDHEGSGRF